MSTDENEEKFTEDRFQCMMIARMKLKEYVLNNAQQGNIQDIIDKIDQFGWTQTWLMNLGDRKGKIVDQALQTRKPKTVLEIGTFLGYSSLRIVTQLPEDALFITIEADSESADIARWIHKYAGVADRIKVINRLSENVIPCLSRDFNLDSFDFIFIDHYKDVYLRDFKLLEQSGLIKSGTMIVADNVITPGAPDYLEYVRNNPNYDTQTHEATLEYKTNVPDAVEVSIRK